MGLELRFVLDFEKEDVKEEELNFRKLLIFSFRSILIDGRTCSTKHVRHASPVCGGHRQNVKHHTFTATSQTEVNIDGRLMQLHPLDNKRQFIAPHFSRWSS